MYATSHAKIRTTRTVWAGDERRTVRVRQPGRGTARRAAIRESAAVTR